MIHVRTLFFVYLRVIESVSLSMLNLGSIPKSNTFLLLKFIVQMGRLAENKQELGPVNFLRVFIVKIHVGRLCITHQSRGVNVQPLMYVWLLV